MKRTATQVAVSEHARVGVLPKDMPKPIRVSSANTSPA